MNDRLTEQIKHLITSLYAQGVRDVVVSPGSRTTPIALLLAEFTTHVVQDMQLHVVLDERDAGFLGLGIAKTGQRPVALLATSGTATANYAPAIAEAWASHVPLIALTTDRPEELQHIGAPQTIEQTGLYGDNIKAATTLTLQNESVDAIDYIDYEVQQLVHQSQLAPAGPIQINLPLRKPLMPELNTDWPQISVLNFPQVKTEITFNPKMVADLQQSMLFLAGPMEQAAYQDVLMTTAKAHRIPVIADVLSDTRFDQGGLVGIDSMIASDLITHLPQPQLVIRFGATPVSAKVLQWLKAQQIEVIQVGQQTLGRDHSRHSTTSLAMDEMTFLAAFNEQAGTNDNAFYHAWLATQQRLEHLLPTDSVLNDLQVVKAMNALPEATQLFIANSMPIRDYDNYWQPKHQVKAFANRGANGIDGTVASAAGMALQAENNWLAIGDLAFFHDLNGIGLAKQLGVNLTILVTNNQGGAIFSFLPQAQADEYFEQLFGTPQNWSIEKVAHLFDADYQLVEDVSELMELVKKPATGLSIIEVPTNRVANVSEHQTIVEKLGGLHADF